MPIELWYETHSTTLDNERGIATGWHPGALSAAGRDQAAMLGERLRQRQCDALFVSDLQRAVETARIAVAGIAIPVIVDARLREWNYGTLNGAPVAHVQAGRQRHIEAPFPDGEALQDVVRRTASFLADLAKGWDGRRVVVIAHSANRWALAHLLERTDLAVLIKAPFAWQPGWRFVIPSGWRANHQENA